MDKFAIIILAAGSSSRFGEAKQLAYHHNKTFIRHAISEAMRTTKNIIVVLGANSEKVKKEIEDFSVHLVFNKDWDEGMSSSIRCGLSALFALNPNAEAAIFMVCDQPFVTSLLLNELIAKYQETNQKIVASAYSNTVGTPVLFGKLFFPALLALKGQSGAKKIIIQNMQSTVTIPFPMGYVDIDTKEDYEALQKKST